MEDGDSVAVHQRFDDIAHMKSTRRQPTPRPSKTIPILPQGTLIMDKYVISEMIGCGGYGQIMRADHTTKRKSVAVKVVIAAHQPRRIGLEQQILYELKGRPEFPTLYGSGKYEQCFFIVMQLLGKSVSEYRRMNSEKRLPVLTVMRIGLQVLKALEVLHDLGYVHRDLKPGNICTSLDKSHGNVYIVDFGLARRFKTENGRLIRRHYVGFRGTVRYVSLNVHEHYEYTPCDDIISLYYSMVEAGEGSLPWGSIKGLQLVEEQKKLHTRLRMNYIVPRFNDFYMFCRDTCRRDDGNSPNYQHMTDMIKALYPQIIDMEDKPLEFNINSVV